MSNPLLLFRRVRPHSIRYLTTTARLSTPGPQANQPPTRAGTEGYRGQGGDTPNTDKQSSASEVEHLSGDDHPAKQPDGQAEPERTTGIGGKEAVKGGKEGQSNISEEGKKNLKGQ